MDGTSEGAREASRLCSVTEVARETGSAYELELDPYGAQLERAPPGRFAKPLDRPLTSPTMPR